MRRATGQHGACTNPRAVRPPYRQSARLASDRPASPSAAKTTRACTPLFFRRVAQRHLDAACAFSLPRRRRQVAESARPRSRLFNQGRIEGFRDIETPSGASSTAAAPVVHNVNRESGTAPSRAGSDPRPARSKAARAAPFRQQPQTL